jgi:hypothetical protein
MADFDWGAAIGAAASLWGSKKGADAAKDAGKQSAAGSTAANDLIWKMFQQQQDQQQPFYNAGVQAQDRYLQMLGLQPTSGAQQQASTQPYDPAAAYLTANPDVAASRFKNDPLAHYQRYGQKEGRAWNTTAPASQAAATKPAALTQQQAFDAFRNTPGYQFGLDQGNKSVQASAAARGGLNSGATLKALQRYGTDYADQQGYTPYMNKLAGLFGGAQTAAGQMGSYGQNAANNIGQNTQNGANARANSTYNAGQAWQQGLNSAGYFANQMGQNQGWWG